MGNPETKAPLYMECCEEALSSAQIVFQKKLETESKELQKKLQDLVKTFDGENIYTGEHFSAYKFNGKIEDIKTKVKTKQTPLRPEKRVYPKTENRNEAQIRIEHEAPAIPDKEEDMPVIKKFKEKISPKTIPAEKQIVKTVEKPKKSIPRLRLSEVNALGGLKIREDKNTSELGINKDPGQSPQGKMFPSFSVFAKPFLKVDEKANFDRGALDSKLKLILIMEPAKFTEWLLQQGLLKTNQKCQFHKNNSLKLGVYSDKTEFPYSGGYVWINECCPTKYVSVFYGSIFEEAQHPPSYILKLIYHWSCQTNVTNVIQWVKVNSAYVKSIYTWLRAICTMSINHYLPLIGGKNKNIEVGVISLGTTSQDGKKRQVKVEIIGVLYFNERLIKLRAIEPFPENEKNIRKRFLRILKPLEEWVDKDSIINIDLTIDKETLNFIGFKNVVQTPTDKQTGERTNKHIMDYLRRIVPKMFSNTLSLLSRQMIQQFLDELVWRENYGTNPNEAFDNIVKHTAEQTKFLKKTTLVQKLYLFATNPFKNWTETEDMEVDSTEKFPKTEKASKPNRITESPNINNNEILKTSKTIDKSKFKEEIQTKPRLSNENLKNKNVIILNKDDEKTLNLIQANFYGILEDTNENSYNFKFMENFSGKCTMCSSIHDNNINLQNHLISHVKLSGKNAKEQCIYCLKKFLSDEILDEHINRYHPLNLISSNVFDFSCLICGYNFRSIYLYNNHMQESHVPLELPYKCSGCNYRSSSHRQTTDHFYEKHLNSNGIQCCLCLMGFKIYDKILLRPKIFEFLVHLQKHTQARDRYKCTKCMLNFTTEAELERHLALDHLSIKTTAKVKKLQPHGTFTQAYKTEDKLQQQDSTFIVTKKLENLEIKIQKGVQCFECDLELETKSHFMNHMKCNNCRYQTFCKNAMLNHTKKCKRIKKGKRSINIMTNKEMHCVCGFSSNNGNILAEHLVTCGHKSVYPSVEIAETNTVKKSMLNILGLMRKDDS